MYCIADITDGLEYQIGGIVTSYQLSSKIRQYISEMLNFFT